MFCRNRTEIYILKKMEEYKVLVVGQTGVGKTATVIIM